MVGVVKQKDKISGELKEIELTFEKYAKKPMAKPQAIYGGMRGRGGAR